MAIAPYVDNGKVSKRVADLNRARQALTEEMDAIGGYEERADATEDKILREVLMHNANDKKEHASLLIEWIRRNDPIFDKKLAAVLFKSAKMDELWD